MVKYTLPLSYIFVFNIQLVFGCVFPDDLQGQTWYTNIRATTRTAIYFRSGVMEYEEQQTEQDYVMKEYESVCVQMVALNKYMIRLESKEYQCVNFVRRSSSVMQIKYSRRSSFNSSDSCENRNLELSPWLFILYSSLWNDFTICPFSGGYNMKIKEPNGLDHACNFIDLPMRLESECLTGEAITFDFRTKHCIRSLPMTVTQRAICVTHWRNDGDVITVLRAPDTDTVWILRIPARKSISDITTMLLMTDVTCEPGRDVRFYTLELEMIVQNTLCTDEHKNCDILPCSQHFESQCLQTCGKCDPNIYPTSCDFPKRFRGNWLIRDNFGTSAVNISSSQIRINRVGTFSCTEFDDTPRRKKQYTTLTFFSNGCRPRYTCLAFKTLNRNVLGLAVSQSTVWPFRTTEVGSTLCESSNFHGDPAPLRDTFRSFNDVFQPLISTSKILNPVTCPIPSSYQFNVTFMNGTTCSGAFYKLCHDTSVLRFEFYNCPYDRFVIDFSCLGTIASRYWEKNIIIDNINVSGDTRCLISSEVEPARMLMFPSGECDKYSWSNTEVGLRAPLLSISVTPELHSCRAPSTVTSTKLGDFVLEPINDAWRAVQNNDVDVTSNDGTHAELITHKHRHHKSHSTTQQTYNVVTDDGRSSVRTRKSSSGAKMSGISSYLLALHVLVYLLRQ